LYVKCNIVTVKNGEPTVTTLAIAEHVQHGHKSVIRLVRDNERDLEQFGTLRFENAKSDGAGRPTEYAILYTRSDRCTSLSIVQKRTISRPSKP
jgi:phage regulator Rha-like protein